MKSLHQMENNPLMQKWKSKIKKRRRRKRKEEIKRKTRVKMILNLSPLI
jgi:hypothetical protein